MITEERVFVAGAGPVGLVAAAALVGRGIPVTVFEGAPALSRESRASTFHPSTLDMLLDDLGVADALVATGLVAPRLQYRHRDRDGVIAAFDFSGIADATRHPYRLAKRAAQTSPASSTVRCERTRITASSSTGASARRARTPMASR